ncbi:hypothetical protein P168DRAFT_324860 [Aspergillus campestris IBT 28561]|uniref:Uncharacterized protein n=1 Tax=Aspergillus campestris (strain IBT 28561) TaxID=1392248 RepID=A0A2I1DC54_ASPC2|nr:uncharacterized protein P168DRAFT_324860 [Aspergillus campestris IBT 28561]PKY07453.1 hypothetical protein P168DRAFT_324860 [Aspergillus campestris IBT 28561]
MFALATLARTSRIGPRWTQLRSVSTLENNPHIVLCYLLQWESHSLPPPHRTPNTSLAIGTTTTLPPTTDSLRENPRFLEILQSVFREYGHQDPDAISQAQVMVSTSGANLSSGGVLMTGARGRRRRESADSSGGASGQGGAGSAGRGGWIHMSDERRPPEYGRIAWPEDIFGSLEVDADGSFVGGNGNYQPSGTYRLVTRDGILGLSPFMREKLVQKLREMESQQ